VFVCLTLTAVHGVGAHDSGIGSGVLNAMQQVGGALGLAVLSTVAVNALTDKANSLMAAAGPNAQAKTVDILHVAFADGATKAFMVGVWLIIVCAVLIWAFLNVPHEELNDHPIPVADADEDEDAVVA
jgi:hypothetical protein